MGQNVRMKWHLFFGSLFCGALVLHGYEDDYSPCVPWEARNVLLLNRYTYDSLPDRDEAKVPLGEKERLSISVRRDGAAPGAVGILSLDGTGQRWRLDDIVWPYLEAVFGADLNADSRTDVILQFANTGCGISGSTTDLIVLLSTEHAYSATFVGTWLFNGNEVMVDNGNTFILHCEFVGGDVGADGKTHNYWLHRRLRVEGSEIRMDTSYKPIWVMFTFAPNHADSAELSSKQKAEIMRNNPVQCKPLVGL